MVYLSTSGCKVNGALTRRVKVLTYRVKVLTCRVRSVTFKISSATCKVKVLTCRAIGAYLQGKWCLPDR